MKHRPRWILLHLLFNSYTMIAPPLPIAFYWGIGDKGVALLSTNGYSQAMTWPLMSSEKLATQ
jgi:hypothetical protein